MPTASQSVNCSDDRDRLRQGMQQRPMTARKFAARIAACAATACLLAPNAQAADDAQVEKVVVKSVARFDFDATSINTADRDAMLSEVGKLKDVTWQTVTATGHTDSVGNAAYNQRLSARRAASVKTFLVGNGLSPDMVRTRGVAATQPVAPNTDEQGRALNRRTEIEFQGVRVSAK